MTVKDIIHRGPPNLPGGRQPGGYPRGRTSANGAWRRWAGSTYPRVCSVIAALGCLVALFVPWLTLDAHATSLSGVGLMSYALQGSDRVVMWRISPVATALPLSLPFGIAVGAMGTAWSVLRRRYRVEVPLLTFAAVLALLRFTPPASLDIAGPDPDSSVPDARPEAAPASGPRENLRNSLHSPALVGN